MIRKIELMIIGGKILLPTTWMEERDD